MEETPVVIVGAGPAGLTLALSLAKLGSIILEKERGITEDPRGVFLAGDAIRILWDIGIRDQIEFIGHQVEDVNFHESSFQNAPFFVQRTTRDYLNQTVPDGISQVQPKLEYALRAAVKGSSFCQLRCGSTVISREELDDGVIVGYNDPEGNMRYTNCSWMIGADGKKGVVRKKFLEPSANVKQETGLFSYTGTWVAANLKIQFPRPDTHPDFPLWRYGYTPEAVYNLFWPSGWHFCTPPGKATACGRFGPMEDRFWRHEFAEPNWNNSMNATELLWEHLLPMVTRDKDAQGSHFPHGKVTFPKDCIEVRRCRPFTFCQKVVNKWFHGRTILIGDAAHVFPPFGGQGIACGIRDAHGLAWRLAMMLGMPNLEKTSTDAILNAWALERRQGVDDSTRLTMANGKLANEPETLGFYLFRKAMGFLSQIPFMPELPSRSDEREGYKPTRKGFFLPEYGGGGKLAQVYLQSSIGKVVLSDELLQQKRTVMTLLIITENSAGDSTLVKNALCIAQMHPAVISEESIRSVCPNRAATLGNITSEPQETEIFYPVPQRHLHDRKIRPGYDESSYIRRIGYSTKYAILRPDFIIFSLANNVSELEKCLLLLKKRLAE